MVHKIAHQVKPDGGLRGAPEDDGVPEKKSSWPPAALPSAFRFRHPQRSFVRPATADVRGRCCTWQLATGSGDVRRATKLAMNRKSLAFRDSLPRPPAACAASIGSDMRRRAAGGGIRIAPGAKHPLAADDTGSIGP
jgi:hypothetical protein